MKYHICYFFLQEGHKEHCCINIPFECHAHKLQKIIVTQRPNVLTDL